MVDKQVGKVRLADLATHFPMGPRNKWEKV